MLQWLWISLVSVAVCLPSAPRTTGQSGQVADFRDGIATLQGFIDREQAPVGSLVYFIYRRTKS